MIQNRNLLTEIEKKHQNTKQLADSLKELGQIINQASSVRFGTVKENIIQSCRHAIKNKNLERIVNILEQGGVGL